jgi:hypothetical protein
MVKSTQPYVAQLPPLDELLLAQPAADEPLQLS